LFCLSRFRDFEISRFRDFEISGRSSHGGAEARRKQRKEPTTRHKGNVLGPVPGVGVMAKGPQGWVKCEDRFPTTKITPAACRGSTTTALRLARTSLGGGRPGSRARSGGALGASMQREGAVPGTASFKIK
jgi:hypothetical protein